MYRRILRFLGGFTLVVFFWVGVYANSLIGVQETAKEYLIALKEGMREEGLNPRLFVISGRRWQWDNWLLTKLSGAASNSQHLAGQAIDIVVLDVNDDGEVNATDVDLVYEILDKKIIQSKGGIGTYKTEQGFFNRQMIHFDIRGKKARWHR